MTADLGYYWRPRQSSADDIADVMTRILLHGQVEELAWQDQAECQYADPESFYPDKGGSSADAKAVCMACSVRVACLEYALARDERFGIWGGLSERQRRNITRSRRRAAA